MPDRSRRALAASAAVLALLAAACGGGDDDGAAPAADGEALEGVFRVDAGACADAGVTGGSYFRMVQPGGTVGAGPFVPNGDSACGDKTWTPLKPGTDGGLRTGRFQPHPDPPFQGNDAVAALITEPTPWFAVRFALATNEVDPQTEAEATAPRITTDGEGGLAGDLRALAAAWNGQHFNQGSPKPDGSRPGNTAGPTGTYDEATGRYTLEWSSQIVGGPFNNFTGVWHLEGTFEEG